ncbi:cytochrome P450 [Raphidocelis subcapitata]|uniref:Cytochrome P450 n=1 Tax=Raphidocelis subcapitata TaxID=307507 RepID=A0A2V0NMT6_9CHLO|nr:cytochrome P450 [Raphidocelis subcapitata]|eukprot:GBF88848.1 cytochrome P450 [Raphidocelis subcapitata]
MELLAGALSLAVLPVLVILARWGANRWRYRRVPGPFAPPIIGNLPELRRHGSLHTYMDACRRRYGRVFKAFNKWIDGLVEASPQNGLMIYLGSKMFLFVAEPEGARKVMYKLINHNVGGMLTADRKAEFKANTKGLFAATGDDWRALRAAWQPAFSSSSLEQYARLMDGCALELAASLGRAGEEGRAVDLWREVGKMTMSVVGTCAYGIDFHTMDAPGRASGAEGAQLVQASQRIFEAGLLSGSAWGRPLLLFPDAERVVAWLAARLPDQALVDVTQARKTIVNVSRGLIRSWRTARGGCSPAPSAAPAAAAAKPAPRAPPAAAPAAAADAPGRDQGGKRPGGATGIAPGSFLGLMLEGNGGGRGGFDDDTVIAQSNTFILAGYETTANTLAYTLYAISANPRVQERVLAEIDAFGRDRAPGHADVAGGAFPYLEATLKESMRLFPAALMTHRLVSRPEGFDVQLPGGGSVNVQHGDTIYTASYCYMRDEAYWPAPLEFRPERFLPEGSALAPSLPLDHVFTPFGGGARLCIGYRFAKEEALIALVRLYQRFTFDLEPGVAPLRMVHRLTLSPADGVRARVVARA